MITVKFVGGAKKSFSTDQLQIEKSDITVQELLEILSSQKPENTPILDTENILVAINGADSSAMEGKSTILKNNDLVSIIPVIHGGSQKKLCFEISKKPIQVIEIKGQNNIDEKFLDNLRKKYSKIKIQAISSKFILNEYHLKKILSLSIESEKNKILLSNRIETDVLMRFAISGQISDAIKNVGIKKKQNFFIIAIGNKKSLNSLSEELSSISENLFSNSNESFLKKHFKISKKQIDSVYSKTPLEDILIEKAAVLF